MYIVKTYRLIFVMLCTSLLLLLSATPIITAQAKVTATLPASPIHLVGQLGGVSRAVATLGEYVYLGVGPRVFILKLDTPSGPGDPAFIAQTAVLPGLVEGIAAQGDYVYVAVKEGLHIIDVSDPIAPFVVGQWQPPEPPAVGVLRWINAVAVSDNYAYLAASSRGLRILDVSNPAAPVEVGSYTTDHANDVAVAGDYVYVADDQGLRIIDVTTPGSPQQTGAVSLGVATGVAVLGDYAYLTLGRSGLRVINTSDRSNPDVSGSAWTQLGSAQGVAVADSRAYVAVATWGQETGGLSVFDIAAPGTPQEIGFTAVAYPSSALGVAVVGNYIYLAAENHGLRTFNVSTPTQPIETGVYQTLGTVRGVAAAGSYVYVADWQGGLRSVDVNNPAQPVVRDAYDTPNPWPGGVATTGTHAYLVDGESLRIVDTLSPTHLSETAVYTTPGTAVAVAVAGQYAYIADTNEGLLILDISDPSAPSKVADFPTAPSGTADGLAVAGNYVYLADRWTGLRIINIANPALPMQVGGVQPTRAATRVALAGNYAYVAGEGFGVIHITNPAAPVEIYNTRGAVSVAARGPYAYVVNGAALRILDMTIPSMPADVGEMITPGDAWDVAVDENYIYVADSAGGLLIYQFPPSVSAVIPTTGGTLTSPFDDVNYTFSPDTFNHAVIVTHTLRLPPDIPPLDGKLSIGRFFDVTAIYSDTAQPAQPFTAYTITVGYADAGLSPASAATLGLYWWDPVGAQWSQTGINSVVDTSAQQVVAQVEHFSLFAVLGELHRVYLPLVLRN